MFAGIVIAAVILTMAIGGSGAFPVFTNPNELATDVYANERFGLQLISVTTGGSLSGPQSSATYYPSVKLINANGPLLNPYYTEGGVNTTYDALKNPQTLTINPNASELRLQFRIAPASTGNPADKTEWVTQLRNYKIWHRLTSFTKISEWFKKYMTEAVSSNTLKPLTPNAHAIENTKITSNNTSYTLPPIYLAENQFVTAGNSSRQDSLYVVRTPGVRLTPVRLIADNIFEYSIPTNKLRFVMAPVLQSRSSLAHPAIYTPADERRFIFTYSGARGSQYLLPREQWLKPTQGPLEERRIPAMTYSAGDLPGPTRWLAIQFQQPAQLPTNDSSSSQTPGVQFTTTLLANPTTIKVGETATLTAALKENGKEVASTKIGYGWNYADNTSDDRGTLSYVSPGVARFKATSAGMVKVYVNFTYQGTKYTSSAISITVNPPNRTPSTLTASLAGFQAGSIALTLSGTNLNGGFTGVSNQKPPAGAYITAEFTNHPTKTYTATQFFGNNSSLTIYDSFSGKTVKKVTYHNPLNSPATLSSTTKL
ncbi:TPA: hypothetical protein DHW58_02275 [Patescibacteria group bacterium]|nr:hypothetical protein [Patescibacteria group bacterium]